MSQPQRFLFRFQLMPSLDDISYDVTLLPTLNLISYLMLKSIWETGFISLVINSAWLLDFLEEIK